MPYSNSENEKKHTSELQTRQRDTKVILAVCSWTQLSLNLHMIARETLVSVNQGMLAPAAEITASFELFHPSPVYSWLRLQSKPILHQPLNALAARLPFPPS